MTIRQEQARNNNNNSIFSCKTRFWRGKSLRWDHARNIASITDAAKIAPRLCNRMFSLTRAAFECRLDRSFVWISFGKDVDWTKPAKMKKKTKR